MSSSTIHHHDLVVVGFGAAALSATVSFVEARQRQGKPPGSIAVLERAPREGRGGATRWTGSWFRITKDRELDPRFADTMAEVSGGLADLEYCARLRDEISTTLDFLEANGVPLTFFEQPFPNGNTGGGLGMPEGGGVAIVEGLGQRVEAADHIDVHYQTEALRLLSDESGRVNGIEARGPDGLLASFHAPAVVLACGGFEGNPEMLTRYLGDRACDLPLVAPTLACNRGDGLRMAMELGGDTAGQFDMFHGEPADPRSSKPDAVVYAFPYGIVVNGDCERFFDEGQDSFDNTFEAFSFEIWKHQDQRAFFIGDQTTREIPNIDQIILTDQPAIEADSLAELAGLLELDSEKLQGTVSRYNSAIQAGDFNPLVRDGKRTEGLSPEKSNWAFPIERPPYIAYPLTCAITFTFGGIRTDSEARVITPTGTAIPGLYAAGEVTGLYYHSYPVGTSVLRACTFGRIAGANAAVATG